ncbi:MAG TPA: DNA recombination protein RmuC [Bacilli bacterium]|nr:DNA recombination protein RmuC [Bacilli bacterium]
MEIATIILSSLSLLAVIVLIFVIVKRKPQPIETKIDLKEIGALEKQIELLSVQIKGDIELSLTKEMGKVSDQTIKNSEVNNEKLERFQQAISTSLNTRFDSLNKQMEDKIALINRKVDEKLSEGFKTTNESMTQVRERLQAIDAAQKNIENLSKDVVSLKQVLEGNQTRGQYGEYQLSMVLHNVFGDTEGCYQEQFTLKKVKDGDDVRADAVVFMPEPNHMICIDSKFPFKDYARMFDAQSEDEKLTLAKDFAGAVKKHITAIKDKYIVEGKTAPEALMFIPNDGVFAFIHHNCRDVIDYAREKKVVLTSPSTLPAILVTINMVKIQVERAKNVEEINHQLQRLSKDFEMFAREWGKFSDALEKTTKSREKLDTRVHKINYKFDAIRGNEKFGEIEESHGEFYDELTGEDDEVEK